MAAAFSPASIVAEHFAVTCQLPGQWDYNILHSWQSYFPASLIHLIPAHIGIEVSCTVITKLNLIMYLIYNGICIYWGSRSKDLAIIHLAVLNQKPEYFRLNTVLVAWASTNQCASWTHSVSLHLQDLNTFNCHVVNSLCSFEAPWSCQCLVEL